MTSRFSAQPREKHPKIRNGKTGRNSLGILQVSVLISSVCKLSTQKCSLQNEFCFLPEQTKADITGFLQEATKPLRTVILDKNILSKTWGFFY